MAVPAAPTLGAYTSTLGFRDFGSISWTHNGGGTPQFAWAMRWRKIGDTDWRGAGYAPISSASSSSFPPNMAQNGTFETNVSNWESNSVFGILTPATFARTTSKASVGTASMEVTWQGGDSWVDAIFLPGTTGSTYLIEADVWVPDGVSDPHIMVWDNGYPITRGAGTTIKDQWTTLRQVYKSVTPDFVYGIEFKDVVKGQQAWIDNVRIREVLDAGNYELAISTFNLDGQSPWSVPVPFTVAEPDVSVNRDGAAVGMVRRVHNGTGWVRSTTVRFS